MAFCVQINVFTSAVQFVQQVILMSASIDCKELADYFALPDKNGLNPACVIKVEGKPFAIEEYYLDDMKHIVKFKVL